jgi:phosphinothricin acetyltransferase
VVSEPTRLRLATLDDAAAILEIYAPYILESTISFEYELPSASEIGERIAAVQRFYPWIVLERDGELLAYAYASRLRTRAAYDWVAETSVYVARAQHGQGLGRHVYQALLDLLALQGLWWAYAGIALPNPVSQRMHERLGFERLGVFPGIGFKHGAWLDLEWWRYRLAPPDAGEPAPVRAIADASLAAALAQRLDHHL